MLQDQIVLERCPCCNKPTRTISLIEAQNNYFKTQREKQGEVKLRSSSHD
jgi:hypothetical protein